MVDVNSIRNKIEQRVFNNLGSAAIYSSMIAGSINSYGDATPTLASTSTITIVPWGLFHEDQEYYVFGDLKVGEMDIAFKYNQEMKVDDLLSYNSKVYKVKSIEHYIIKDAIIVKVARIYESI